MHNYGLPREAVLRMMDTQGERDALRRFQSLADGIPYLLLSGSRSPGT